eukprot:8761143-Heterocapsa_arctica.AAC.2
MAEWVTGEIIVKRGTSLDAGCPTIPADPKRQGSSQMVERIAKHTTQPTRSVARWTTEVVGQVSDLSQNGYGHSIV